MFVSNCMEQQSNVYGRGGDVFCIAGWVAGACRSDLLRGFAISNMCALLSAMSFHWIYDKKATVLEASAVTMSCFLGSLAPNLKTEFSSGS